MISVNFDGCAGWLHEAAGSRGVVVVGAQGFESLCGAHAMRRLADHLVAANLPVLRVDLHGCGDSDGADTDPERVSTWIRNVGAAVDFLRAETGVAEVALVGLRLGALLALASAAKSPADRLALLAPPATGTAYLRDMRVMAQVLAGGDAGAGHAPDGGLDVAGFVMTSKTLADIEALWLPATYARPAADVLVMAPETGRRVGRLVAALELAGARVIETPFDGYGKMMADPTAGIVPEPALRTLTAWLAEGVPPATRDVPARPSAILRGAGWEEDGVVFGPAGRSAGIVCRPRGIRVRSRAAVFVNAGGIPHVGWARMYVTLARELAAAGILSLRMDVPGIGDGAAWGGPGYPTFHEPAVRDEIRAGIDLLMARGAGSVAVIGGCSGAHQAFHTGVADPRVDALALVNLICFVWGPQYAIPQTAWRMAREREMESRKRAVGEGGAAGFRERVVDAVMPRLKAATRDVLEGVKAGLSPLRRQLALRRAALNPVEQSFRDLAARGVRTALIYSDGDKSQAELDRYMGPGGERAALLTGVSVHVLPDADHPLTPAPARARFAALVAELLDVPGATGAASTDRLATLGTAA